jgi:hypothetical protein
MGLVKSLVLWLVGALAGVTAAESEYAVKAAYLVKFPFYVEWPATAFASPTAPLTMCIIGDDPFGSLLDEAAAGQQVQGHPLALRRLRTPPRDNACHVAYVGADARADALRGTGTLVVTDGPAEHGVIHFVIKDSRVRFTVDDEAAAQSGLTISSRLLNVALAVKPRGAR